MATAPSAPMGRGGALWDRLFVPLVAAGAGSITRRLLGAPQHDLPAAVRATPTDRPADRSPGHGRDRRRPLPIVFGLPAVHTFFHRLRNPLVYVTLGGIVLGLLGAIGGELTLFKGPARPASCRPTSTAGESAP